MRDKFDEEWMQPSYFLIEPTLYFQIYYPYINEIQCGFLYL